MAVTSRAVSPVNISRLLPLLLLAACSAADSGRSTSPTAIAQPCASAARVDTAGWQVIQRGAFVFRIPACAPQEVRSVDSAVDEWRSPEARVVHSDYGMWTGPVQRGPNSRMREPITVCAMGDSTSAPQLVVYRTFEGAQAAGLYWPTPGGRSRLFGPSGENIQREALWLEAASPHAEDLPELLAIVQSVRLRPVP